MILCTLIILLKITGKILLVSNTANTRKLIQEEARTMTSDTVIIAEMKTFFITVLSKNYAGKTITSRK